MPFASLEKDSEDPELPQGRRGELGGQRHDRIHHTRDQIGPTMAPSDDDETDPGLAISMTQKMLSAVTGSVLTSLLVTPLDVVRVRLQSQSTPSHRPSPTNLAGVSSFSNLPPNLGISACCREVFWVNNNAPYCVASPSIPSSTAALDACAAEEVQRKNFTSTFDGLRKIARNEGPRTLWRGLSPTLVMAIPANVIYFAGYDWLRTSRTSPLTHGVFKIHDAYAPLVAGSFARILAAIAVSPIEMFRTRMQAAHHASGPTGHFRETLHGLREMVGVEGYRSLWRGLNLTLWRDVPFSAIYWWGYESGRDVLTDVRERSRGRRDSVSVRDDRRSRSRSREKENTTATLVDSFIAGAASGAVAALVTTPFDVGKTRQQIAKHSSQQVSNANFFRPEDLAMPRFLWHILKEEGMSGLFKGWAARCLKVAPACAIMISSYEIGKKMAGGMNERRESRSQHE